MQPKFSKEQLMRVRDQALMYQCACPAQVSILLGEVMSLFEYQEACLNQTDTDARVHTSIAQATELAYPIFEQCLTDVLLLEGWNMETLEMPELLKKRMVDSV
ncbi:MAG: hypothetical protein ABTQ26_13350 [Azonexus sp.]